MPDEKDADQIERDVARAGAGPAATAAGLVDLGKRTAAALVGALAEHFVPGAGIPAGLLAAAFATSVIELRKNLDDHAVRDAARQLGDRAPEIAQKLDALRATGFGSPADVRALVDAYLAAWTAQADGRVRDLIENAAVNGFDPRRYREGVTRRILRVLGELEYGDIEQLRHFYREDTQNSARGGATPWMDPGSMNAHHATRLVDHGLAWKPTIDRRAERLGLEVSEVEHAHTTELGKRLLEHIKREGDAKAAQTVDEDIVRGGKSGPKR